MLVAVWNNLSNFTYLKASGDVGLRLCEPRNDGLGKFEEEGFSLLGAFALMSKGKLLVGAAAELDEIKLVLLEHGTKFLRFLGIEAFVLELHGVQLNANDKFWLRPPSDLLRNL